MGLYILRRVLWTFLLLFLITARLYGRRVGYLAAAFSGLAVMQIQQYYYSHN